MDNGVTDYGILVWPAYRAGFYITKDPDTMWPGKFDWLVAVKNPNCQSMGHFGSLEAAYIWAYKQIGRELR